MFLSQARQFIKHLSHPLLTINSGDTQFTHGETRATEVKGVRGRARILSLSGSMWLDSLPDSVDVYASNNNFTGQEHLSFLSLCTWWLKEQARGIGTRPGPSQAL